MEALNLTYDEVVNRIPYRNLLVMARDKQHLATGDVMVEVSEEEYFNKRGETNPFCKESKKNRQNDENKR